MQYHLILPHFQKICYNEDTFPGSSMVEQEAVNFEVASSSLARGAIEIKENPPWVLFYFYSFFLEQT